MKKSIGSDSHALVREARNALRGRSAGGGVPAAVAAMIRFCAGQIMPHTFSSSHMPSHAQALAFALCAFDFRIYIAKYPRPARTVATAPQRKYQSARGISSGTAIFLVGPSSFFINGTLTRLKK